MWTRSRSAFVSSKRLHLRPRSGRTEHNVGLDSLGRRRVETEARMNVVRRWRGVLHRRSATCVVLSARGFHDSSLPTPARDRVAVPVEARGLRAGLARRSSSPSSRVTLHWQYSLHETSCRRRKHQERAFDPRRRSAAPSSASSGVRHGFITVALPIALACRLHHRAGSVRSRASGVALHRHCRANIGWEALFIDRAALRSPV